MATVQYLGGEKKINQNEIDGIVLRFYLDPLKEIGIDQIIEGEVSNKSHLNYENSYPYYDFTFRSSYNYAQDINFQINFLFAKIDNALAKKFGETYKHLPISNDCYWVQDLPTHQKN